MVKRGYKTNLKRKRMVIGICLFLGLIGSMVFYLWIYNYTNTLYREIDQLRRKEALMVARNRALQIEIETLMRPDRIKTIAMNDIGMVFPNPETLAVIIEPQISVNR